MGKNIIWIDSCRHPWIGVHPSQAGALEVAPRTGGVGGCRNLITAMAQLGTALGVRLAFNLRGGGGILNPIRRGMEMVETEIVSHSVRLVHVRRGRASVQHRGQVIESGLISCKGVVVEHFAGGPHGAPWGAEGVGARLRQVKDMRAGHPVALDASARDGLKGHKAVAIGDVDFEKLGAGIHHKRRKSPICGIGCTETSVKGNIATRIMDKSGGCEAAGLLAKTAALVRIDNAAMLNSARLGKGLEVLGEKIAYAGLVLDAARSFGKVLLAGVAQGDSRAVAVAPLVPYGLRGADDEVLSSGKIHEAVYFCGTGRSLRPNRGNKLNNNLGEL